jgi:MFS transporter, DHA3 family, macrolide efflux protein
MKTTKEHLWSKSFFLLWQGQLVSTLGDAAYTIALGFWILKVTGSTALMGSLMAVSALSGVLISPFAGVWIERLNKKRLLIAMDIFRGISMLLIAIAAFSNKLEVWMMFVAGIILSICGAVFRPGVNSTIPEIVPLTRLTNANSILSIVSTGSSMLGNIAGGYLFQLIGAPLLFLFNGISYFFSGSSLTFIKIPKSQPAPKQTFLSDIKEGFQFMWEQKGLRYLLIITALMNFFSYVAIVLFLPFFQKTSYLGASRYGIAMACFMGGAMSGFVFSSLITIPANNRLLIFIGSNIIFNSSFTIALNQSMFGVMVFFIFIGGFFNSIINVILISTVQASTPSIMRGKVMAFISMTTQCLTPFAMAFGGILASYIPIRIIISVSFLLLIFLVTPFTFVKSFTRYISYSDTPTVGETSN